MSRQGWPRRSRQCQHHVEQTLNFTQKNVANICGIVGFFSCKTAPNFSLSSSAFAKILKVPIKNYSLNYFVVVLDPAGRRCADGGGEEGHHAEEGGRGVDGDQRDFQVIYFSYIVFIACYLQGSVSWCKVQ
jgi:hypothetical protein